MKLQLKWKIFSFLLGFCALLLVILWLFQTVFLNDMYKFIRKDEMNKAISLVSRNIESDTLQDIFIQLANDSEILVTPSDTFIPQFKPKEDYRGDDRAKPKAESLTEHREFVLSDGSVKSLTFHAMITPVEATVSTLELQLYIITGIMIALSVLLALIIARRVSKPIEDINESAKVLAKGRYDTHFDGHGYVEISELSNTLNAAALELSKVEGLRRELMANISHDLRTPLSLIYSYAEMMNDFPEEITFEQTKLIMDETRRLNTLVSDVLEISKLESGVQTLCKHEFNLTISVGDVINRIEELVRKDGYTFEFKHDGEVTVCADELKLSQVLYNLVINAINYAGADKLIVVHQTVEDDRVKLSVEDHGEGIPQENLPYIWERYYKVDKVHKRAVAGSGLGLSIVKQIVGLHSGECGVESELGRGSTFWVNIPLGDQIGM